MGLNSSIQFKNAIDKAFTTQPNVKINSSTMRDAAKLKQSFKEEKLVGGKADKMSLGDIAQKHAYDDSKDSTSKDKINKMLSHLKSQFEKGLKVEKEHTKDVAKAKEIVMDHLSEDPHYYTKLSKIENKEDYAKSAKKQFSQDLQSDKDYIEFKKRANYKQGFKDFNFGTPNVTKDDPYIQKRKWSRPGKQETTEVKTNELKGNDKDMVSGILQILNQIEDKENRMKVAKNMIQKFKKEGIKFDYNNFLQKCGLGKKTETKEATGSGSSRAFAGPIAFKDSEFLRNSFKETPKLKEGIAVNAMGLHGIEKAETKEATGSGSVGGYETPAMWAKSTKKKDWGPSRKSQIPGGSFVKVKKKCTKFPYCNQGDINALKITKNESVRKAIKSISEKFNIGENVIITILEHEFQKINKREK